MGMPTVELGVDIKWIMAELDRAGVPQGHDSTDGLPSSPEGRVRWLVNNYLREHDQLQRLLGIEVVRSYLESP